MDNNSQPKKLWFIPPRCLTTDLLLLEFQSTHELIYQIDEKYHSGKAPAKSVLIRRFFGYQPYVFLRNKMISAELHHRTGSSLVDVPKSIIKFGESYYYATNKMIQEHCSQVYDYWEDMNNSEKITELSVLSSYQINQELRYLFSMYKEKYGA